MLIYTSYIIILIMLLFLSGFFSASEVALVSLREVRLRQMLAAKKLGANYIKKLKETPHRMLATILLGNNIVNIAASAITTALFIDIFKNYAVGIAIGVMTILILVFGEIFPKSIAATHNELVSSIVSGPIWYLSIVLSPILNLFQRILNVFPKLFGIKFNARMFTEDDIIAMVKLAEEEGSIKRSEKEMLENVLEFHDKKVSEIATPKINMVQISSISKVEDIIKLMRIKKFSRIPVYKKNHDDIIGIVYAKDIIKFIDNDKTDESVLKLAKKPYFVSETMKISSLLRKFQKKHLHMAIVVDKHGITSGLVTLEDILEEIVGEIKDEVENNLLKMKKLKSGKWIVFGEASIDDINKKMGINIKKEGYNTLSGFMIYRLGAIPKKDDTLAYSGFTFKVKQVDKNRISKVIVEKQ